MVLFLFYFIESACFLLCFCSHCGRDHVDDRQHFKCRCIVTQVEKIPEFLADHRFPASFDRLSLLIAQVWCSSTSVRGARHKETREREQLQWARWPSAWDWRIDLSPKSNLEHGRNPGLMMVERVSWCHWCNKEEGGASAHRALCTVWQDCLLFLASRIIIQHILLYILVKIRHGFKCTW